MTVLGLILLLTLFSMRSMKLRHLVIKTIPTWLFISVFTHYKKLYRMFCLFYSTNFSEFFNTIRIFTLGFDCICLSNYLRFISFSIIIRFDSSSVFPNEFYLLVFFEFLDANDFYNMTASS